MPWLPQQLDILTLISAATSFAGLIVSIWTLVVASRVRTKLQDFRDALARKVAFEELVGDLSRVPLRLKKCIDSSDIEQARRHAVRTSKLLRDTQSSAPAQRRDTIEMLAMQFDQALARDDAKGVLKELRRCTEELEGLVESLNRDQRLKSLRGDHD